MAIVQTMAKYNLRPFCTRNFDSAVFQLMSQDTSRSAHTSHASGSRSIQTEIFNFPVNHILQVSVTEYCAVIGTHSTVRGDKLLYGQIPDPFPRCGIGSGHARLLPTQVKYEEWTFCLRVHSGQVTSVSLCWVQSMSGNSCEFPYRVNERAS